MTMQKIAITFGSLLILLGLGTYFASNMVSVTALIPAFFGIVIVICGFVVMAKPGLRKHVMHVAALVGLLGIVAPLGRLLPKVFKGTVVWNMASLSMVVMSLICVAFVAFCVKSFIDARRNPPAA